MGVEYDQPAHLLDRYIKGGDINGGRLYTGRSMQCTSHFPEINGYGFGWPPVVPLLGISR